jgi:hypothetical protein
LRDQIKEKEGRGERRREEGGRRDEGGRHHRAEDKGSKQHGD